MITVEQIREIAASCTAIMDAAAEADPMRPSAIRMSILDVLCAATIDRVAASGHDVRMLLRQHEKHVRQLMRTPL